MENSEDTNDIVGNEVSPLPVMLYGRPNSINTVMVRTRLAHYDIPFVELDVENDRSAARMVEKINQGELKTPVVVFGDDEFHIVEPNQEELDHGLRKAGYSL
jgi:hypothetical protein